MLLVTLGLELGVKIDFASDSISNKNHKYEDNPCYIWLELEACVEMLDLQRQAKQPLLAVDSG